MKTTIRFFWVPVLALSLLLGAACNTTKTSEGAVIGGTAGGVIGGVIGGEDNTAAGVIIGSAIGGTAGALIGNYMDKQAEEIEEDLEDAEVERVGEGILITFDSGLLFDLDSYQLRAETKENLTELSDALKEYDETNIIIEGHTDSQGTDSYNQRLSERRARSVSGYLAKQNVSSSRFTVRGYGEEKPVATNETAAGRQENRRVEVAIVANEDLKEAAQEGEIGE
ncbi:MAG: OmpA family protein [Phaeodactylibacter xiamenensis]|jgi:outer membrane protein OmpA-like peptidoglycan-associated protein|uniref:Membrane protein n=2 Tax=Phaeodactylibacter xiamenensis TaxID=1524460 RepID=A0A098SB94_9BACT|nr:OmpA family protein [Phaeodactylibacter xiamenensis]KGE88923.1 membrane protein [Phaeodactylibacter xiamenensis]MCR9052678.1 OmpA family protein [bacterium]